MVSGAREGGSSEKKRFVEWRRDDPCYAERGDSRRKGIRAQQNRSKGEEGKPHLAQNGRRLMLQGPGRGVEAAR